MLQIHALTDVADHDVRVFRSTREEGSMILPRSGPDTLGAGRNRQRAFTSVELTPTQIVSARLSHGAGVAAVSHADAGRMIPIVDGLVTNEANLALSITGADCLPLVAFDPVHHAIGIAHAGWRGLAANVPRAFVSAFINNFGTNPGDLAVGIGPGICVQHYAVGHDVAAQFSGIPDAVITDGDVTKLNLAAVAKAQLVAAGVLADHVSIDSTCTFEDPTCFSARRDQADPLEGMAIVIVRQEHHAPR